MDVSFISATLVLPAVIERPFRARPTRATVQIVVLVKPQFEVGRELVGKGGIVRDEAAQQSAVVKVEAALGELGGVRTDSTESPILGAEGNREFLLYAGFYGHLPDVRQVRRSDLLRFATAVRCARGFCSTIQLLQSAST